MPEWKVAKHIQPFLVLSLGEWAGVGEDFALQETCLFILFLDLKGKHFLLPGFLF